MTLPVAIVLGVDSAIGLTVVRELGRLGVPVVLVADTDDVDDNVRSLQGGTDLLELGT